MMKRIQMITKIIKFFIFIIFFTNLSYAEIDKYSDFAALLVGDDRGNITRIENGTTVRPLASITKMMTAVLVLEKIYDGKISMKDTVVISDVASKIPYGIQLIAGKRYTVRDLLHAAIIRSSNNAAYALGEFVGGNAQDFVKLMNYRANTLDMKNTTFCTPHGLPPSYTGTCMDQGSVEDIYKLSMYVLKFPEYLEISSKKNATIDNGTVSLKSTNTLLSRNIGVDGLKTGYHNAAGSNITVSAKNNNKRIIAILLGATRAANRNDIIEKEVLENFQQNKRIIKRINVPNSYSPSNISIEDLINEHLKASSNIRISENNIKIIDKTKEFYTVTINKREYGLYPEEDVYAKTKVSIKYEFTINRKLVTGDNNKVVGMYTGEDNQGNTYVGGLILREK